MATSVATGTKGMCHYGYNERKDPGSSLYKLNYLPFGIFVVNLSQKIIQALYQGSLSSHNLSVSSLLIGTIISAGSISREMFGG